MPEKPVKSATDYCETKKCANEASPKSKAMGWKELYLKEDWWAIYLGLGITLLAVVAFMNGSALLKSLAINPGGLKWTSIDQLFAHFANNIQLYVLQFVCWVVIFGITTRIMRIKTSEFVPAFVILYLLSIVAFSIGGWANAGKYMLEPPLVALLMGLAIANFVPFPKWMDSGFRVEYYIKTGIVLLGATFPLRLVASAGPVALLEATIIALSTCLTIYFVSTKVFGLDKRLAAVLGTGGAVCGVSGSMAIGSAVGAKKEHIYSAITMVVIWALVMIVFIPFVSNILKLNPGIAGAWVGTSEFADAAGFAAASAYGRLAGNEDAAIQGFTLMKVIGRDIWIGIWSFVFALIACLKWEKEECGVRPSPMEIWWRFPKFVLGFFVASLIMTSLVAGYSAVDFKTLVKPNLFGPIAGIRTWAFIFCFLSIGLTSRFKELKEAGLKPAFAFTIGVLVNVVLGFTLSVYVFGDYWSQLGR
ncbi:MAG TPA: putative sulfate exporter family transporter [Dissulfurispiraceae bacterium]|nr:putative sulfate exporter family transporter [Dissulfurispiraceae bacterium]